MMNQFNTIALLSSMLVVAAGSSIVTATLQRPNEADAVRTVSILLQPGQEYPPIGSRVDVLIRRRQLLVDATVVEHSTSLYEPRIYIRVTPEDQVRLSHEAARAAVQGERLSFVSLAEKRDQMRQELMRR